MYMSNRDVEILKNSREGGYHGGGANHRISVYRFKSPITVGIHRPRNSALVQLPAGSIFYAADSKPDSDGIIDGISHGEMVKLFSRDLEELAELVAVENTF